MFLHEEVCDAITNRDDQVRLSDILASISQIIIPLGHGLVVGMLLPPNFVGIKQPSNP